MLGIWKVFFKSWMLLKVFLFVTKSIVMPVDVNLQGKSNKQVQKNEHNS